MEFFYLDEIGWFMLIYGLIFTLPKFIRYMRSSSKGKGDDDPAGNDNINRDFHDYM